VFVVVGEDLGDDPVEASGYGIANLKRVVPNLVEWTTRPGENYDDLEELYGELIGQWSRYVGHVFTVIGGVHVDRKTADQSGPVYEAIPRDRQEEALAFIAAEVLEAPVWLNEREIMDRIDTPGFETVSARQAGALGQLLDDGRLVRMAAIAVDRPEGAYPLPDYLEDVTEAVFLDPAETAADPYRRALHRAYLDAMEALMSEDEEGGGFGPAPEIGRSDVRPVVRMQLRLLRDELVAATPAAPDRTAEAHLADLLERIDDIGPGSNGG